MLNKYTIGLGVMATTAAAAGTVAVAVNNNEEMKIHFQGRMFNSEDEVIDYMFSSNFLRVEKENVIGDLQNSYSNYDLCTLHKGKLPTYDPTNVSFAWRMANGMLTDDLEAAKETYFNEGISNILYSDGYGNDFLSQGDAIISAKNNISNMFNPYVKLPVLESDGSFKNETREYNPFNEADVDALLENIDINKFMDIVNSNYQGDTGFEVSGVVPNSTTLDVNIDGGTEFLWYSIPASEQVYSTGTRQIGEWYANEKLSLSYESEPNTFTPYIENNGDWVEGVSGDTTGTYFVAGSNKWHRGVRFTTEASYSKASNLARDLIESPSDHISIHVDTNEGGDGTINFSDSSTQSKIPDIYDFTNSATQKNNMINDIRDELIVKYGNDAELTNIFAKFGNDIDYTIESTEISLELPGSGDEETTVNKFVSANYSHSGSIANRFGIKQFSNPKIYNKPTSYKIDFSNIPQWARSYLATLGSTNNVDNNLYLSYNNQKLFEIIISKTNQDNPYSLQPLSEMKEKISSELDELNTDGAIKDNLSLDYDNTQGQDAIDVLHNYYRQSEILDENWDITYMLDIDKILHLETYSYSNQLITSIGRFNPSFSTSTTPTTFITSAQDFAFQENSFVPIPVAKYVFYDLNGKKIEYSEDAYDSFELMKRNIMRNIYVPKSSTYVYYNDGTTIQQIMNEQHSIYKINVEGIDVYFAEHQKMRNYIKNILQNFVKYI